MVATRNGHVDLGALVLYISNTEVYKIFINAGTIGAMCSFIKVLIYMNKTLSGELKNKGKSSWSIPKVVAAACESNSSQSLSHSSNQGFHEGGRKAGRFRVGWQGLL